MENPAHRWTYAQPKFADSCQPVAFIMAACDRSARRQNFRLPQRFFRAHVRSAGLIVEFTRAAMTLHLPCQ
jgi:hypothetical protein